jgi:hypothetical protein
MVVQGVGAEVVVLQILVFMEQAYSQVNQDYLALMDMDIRAEIIQTFQVIPVLEVAVLEVAVLEADLAV